MQSSGSSFRGAHLDAPIVASDDWYSDGLVRAPRLRTKASKSPPMSENFNNVAFAHAFSVHKVAFYLVSEQDFVQYALYFSAFWTAWTLSAEYACRYNDVDLGVERRESFFVQIAPGIHSPKVDPVAW